MRAYDIYRPALTDLGLSSAIYRAVSAVMDWMETRKTRDVLSGLSDETLSDIGLTRSDIQKLR